MAHTPIPAYSYHVHDLEQLRYPGKLPVPANMNGSPVVTDEVLAKTLRHFAEHGLGAAGKALENAEQAFLAGDAEKGLHWLEIGRALDRRGAAKLERDLAS